MNTNETNGFGINNTSENQSVNEKNTSRQNMPHINGNYVTNKAPNISNHPMQTTKTAIDTKNIVIIILSVLLVIAVGICIYFAVFYKNKTDAAVTKPDISSEPLAKQRCSICNQTCSNDNYKSYAEGTVIVCQDCYDNAASNIGTAESIDSFFEKMGGGDSYKSSSQIPPTYSIVGSSNVVRGDFGIINITNFNENDKLLVASDFPFPKELQVFKNPDSPAESFAFLPIEIWSKGPVGSYDITFSNGNSTMTKVIKINDSNALKPTVEKQELFVSDNNLADSFSEKSLTEFYDIVSQMTDSTEKKPLWNGVFRYPNAENKKNTGIGMADYGTYRTVNINGLYSTSYYHNGIDIAMAEGENVLASNNGKVVFAGELEITGNTVIIDHGCSILSIYGHLKSINVEKNAIVNKSDIIGTAGKTGFAVSESNTDTTPANQVHFSISMQGRFISPVWMIKYGIPF